MVTLLIGIHDHQPVGNLGDVLEKAYRRAYKPFLDAFEKQPAARVSLHHSGILFEWLEAHHRDYVDRVAALARAGRVELLGGGFYEPILAALPEKDQAGQIARMQDYLARRFGASAQGFWLAERVWEPHLPKVLAQAGLRYTILDDTHFLAVGFSDAELRGHYLTEAEGQSVKVFPISQRLRYLMPYAEPQEVIAYLRSAGEAAQGREVALTMADDGEKFGLWPGTFERVYERGWLDRFFALCAENASWLKLTTFSEHLAAVPPLGWAYLPTTSYAELSDWALGPEPSRDLAAALHRMPAEGRRFVRGGYFRNFLTKYPEANRLYRKMLRASKKVHALERAPKGKKAPELGEALGHLWKGQCNCAYWHGVFGGLYLPHLRHALYENLIRAEAAADRLAPPSGALAPFAVEEDDWDADGVPELLVDGPGASWYLARRGGGLWEWDMKARGVNLGGVVSRRREAYHDAVRVKQPGLEKELCYDWHGRMSLLDHFLHPDTTREGFASARYGEQGDFVLEEYRADKPAVEHGALTLAFQRDGAVWCRSAAVPVRVRKELALKASGGWSCRVTLENRGDRPAELWYGLELALAFATENVCGAVDEKGVALKTFHDEHRAGDVRLALERPLDLWGFPLYTISQSEEGFERTYQGSVLLLHQRMTLAPRASAGLGVSLEAA